MIISRTPVRISLFGGGTDFYDYYSIHTGRVLSSTINKYIYVILNSRFDNQIVINYYEKEIVNSVNDIKHSLVREALHKTGIKNAIEITIITDIPSEGSGLGSSSSLTVGLLNAMYTYLGIKVNAETLASEACDIEINRCHKPIGKQDQYISAFGGLCDIVFNKDDTVQVNKLIISKEQILNLNSKLLLFYTGLTRNSELILSEQRSNISNKVNQLHNLKNFINDAIESIYQVDSNLIGYLLKQTWELKKQLSSNISNELLDKMYSQAMEAGAIGGKILGAGGGGFLLTFVKNEDKDTLRKTMVGFKELEFDFEPEGSKIILKL